MPLEDLRSKTKGSLTVLIREGGPVARIWNQRITKDTASNFLNESGIENATLIKENLEDAVAKGHVAGAEVVVFH